MCSGIHFCSECGSSYNIEKHHIVFRSQASYMTKIKQNIKYLCGEHHRGNNGPHKNESVDSKYKKELQDKYYELLPNEYYTIEQLSKALGCTETQARNICKIIRIKKEGYPKEQIIFRMMGQKFYSDEEELNKCV